MEGLPEATTSAMLSLLFQQFPGFESVNMVESRPGIAFVAFENELAAGVALGGLSGFKVSSTHSLILSYAK